MLRPKTFPILSSRSTADACFDAMVRHAAPRRRSTAPAADASGSAWISEDLTEDMELAWGAREVAIAMFGLSTDTSENQRRRRRVFAMYEGYRKARAEALKCKKPLPANPGWVLLPRCARIILSRSAYRSFLAAQLRGNR